MIHRRAFARRAAPPAMRQARFHEPPLFSGAVALQAGPHGGLVWQAPRDLRFAEACTALPIALPEALAAAASLPLALAPGRVPRPMVVLSPGGDTRTPLLRDGRLVGRYLPAILRFYPFLPVLDGPGLRAVVAGDLAGAHLLKGRASDGWRPVFGPGGQLAPEAAERVQALSVWQAQRDAALSAARALKAAGLLRPAPLAGEGWQTVDPARLPDLPEPTLGRLNRCGALALAYALVTGATHLPRLVAAEHSAVPASLAAGGDFLAAFARGADADADAGATLLWSEDGSA